MTSLYDKYRARAAANFANRDAQRCPPDPEARFMLRLLTARLNDLCVGRMRLLQLPAAPAPDATGRERAGEGQQ